MLLRLVYALSGSLILFNLLVAVGPVNDLPNATALLNDSTWFGKAQTHNLTFKYDRPCTDKHFSIGIVTDIPHSRGYYDRAAPITGCMNRCLPTQILHIAGIPLKVGKYNLSKLQRCYGASFPAGYILLDGGDVSVVDFYGQEGWVEVTTYKPASKQLEGKFEVTLKSKQGEVVRFTNGTFKTKLVKGLD